MDKDLKALQESHQALEQQNNTLAGQVKALLESGRRRDARDFVKDLIPAGLPVAAKARIVEAVTANPPIKDDALDTAALTEATKTATAREVAYIRELGGGVEIVGFGESAGNDGDGEPDAETLTVGLTEGFKLLGLNESAAAIAAKGKE